MPPFYHQRSPAGRAGARARLLAMPADGALDEQVTLAPGPVESAGAATKQLWATLKAVIVEGGAWLGRGTFGFLT